MKSSYQYTHRLDDDGKENKMDEGSNMCAILADSKASGMLAVTATAIACSKSWQCGWQT